MKPKVRSRLVSCLAERLVPEFEKRSFVSIPLNEAERRSELGTAFPFGRLRRRTASGFDLVEIQFDKDGSATFRLNVGHTPAVGIEHAAGHVAAEDVWVHYLDHFCTLYSGRFFRRWLQAREGASQADIDDLIQFVIGLLPQIDDYLQHAKRGRNLRCV